MKTSIGQWVFFIGLLLTLMGVYGFVRIAYVTLRGVPYPLSGVLPSTILVPGTPFAFGGHESDCDVNQQVYYQADGVTPRQPSGEEKNQAQQMRQRCTNEFNEDRARQSQSDRNQSAFLLFVGAGLIIGRKFAERV